MRSFEVPLFHYSDLSLTAFQFFFFSSTFQQKSSSLSAKNNPVEQRQDVTVCSNLSLVLLCKLSLDSLEQIKN